MKVNSKSIYINVIEIERRIKEELDKRKKASNAHESQRKINDKFDSYE